jgi:hypothetical protein
MLLYLATTQTPTTAPPGTADRLAHSWQALIEHLTHTPPTPNDTN